MKGDLDYFADTLLLEKVFKIAEISDDKLIKTAFDLQSILGSIKSSVESAVGSAVNAESPVSSVFNMLVPGILFKVHPALGMLATVGQLLGFDLISVFTKIADMVKRALASGHSLTASDINDFGRQAAPELSSTADLFYGFRELEKNGQLMKSAQFWGTLSDANKNNPLLGGGNKTNAWYRMFSFLGPKKSKSFLLGFVVWLIKTVLLSAGLLVAGSAIKSMIGGENKPTTTTEQQPEQTTQSPLAATPITSFFSSPKVPMPSPSGTGQVKMRQNPSDLWVESLDGDKPSDMIYDWTIESYPTLEQYKDIIMNSPSFWAAVRAVTKNWPVNQPKIVIPNQFSKKDDVLALFVPDVYRTINQKASNQ